MNQDNERYVSVSGRSIPVGVRHWIDAFDADPTWGHVRFKSFMELPGYVPNRFPARLWDLVHQSEFEKDEPGRVPLLTGTQFGVAPRPERLRLAGSERSAAVFAYSALSGHIAGLFIYRLERDDSGFRLAQKIAGFRNRPLTPEGKHQAP